MDVLVHLLRAKEREETDARCQLSKLSLVLLFICVGGVEEEQNYKDFPQKHRMKMGLHELDRIDHL